MDKEELVPSLRFSGYNDVWDQRMLSNIATEVNRNDPESFAPIMMITANNGFIEQSERYAFNNAGESLKKYILLKKGELAYNHGASKLRPYGSCFSLTTAENARIPFVYHCFAVGENDPEFVSIELNGSRIEGQLRKIVSSGARMDGLLNISFEEYCSVELMLPSVPEQEILSCFFRNLDNFITLHQNEYDKLLIMKKNMLGKMFPKKGSQVPEVRFSEFDGAWDYRKLGAISDKITEKNCYMEFTETLTNSAEYGIISQRDFFNHDIAKQDKISGYYIVRPEDFVYNPRISTTAPVGPIGRNKLGRCGVISPLYTVFRPKEVDNSFLEQFFKSSHWYSFMRFNGDTGARSDRFSIKDTTFFEMPIPFPKVEEQRRIGQYLAGLDVLISHQKKKLTKLKNIKAGCLEKMFV